MENDYAGFTEDQVLQQIFIDEQFPVDDTANKAKEEKQKLAGSKVAIGYDYNEVGIRFPWLFFERESSYVGRKKAEDCLRKDILIGRNKRKQRTF